MNNLISNAILQLGSLYDFLVSMAYSQYSSELFIQKSALLGWFNK